jgi:hypothetical protein
VGIKIPRAASSKANVNCTIPRRLDRADYVQVYKIIDALTSSEVRWITEQFRGLRGKKVLEIGSGTSEIALCFALQGADVTRWCKRLSHCMLPHDWYIRALGGSVRDCGWIAHNVRVSGGSI